MKIINYVFLVLLCYSFIACSDDDDSGKANKLTVYSHLDSGEPTLLNQSVINLSDCIDLDVTVEDMDIAIPMYEFVEERFTITPLKEGTTVVTVKEKNKVKYKIKVIVEYEGAGNWTPIESKITVESDADVKEAIEKDVLENSLFYDEQEKSINYSLFSYENEYAIVRGQEKTKYSFYKYLKESQEYEFTMKPSGEKYLYKFILKSKSNVGVLPQSKSGLYYVDKTKEYQEKYPNKNIRKVIEEQKMECVYNN